MIPSENSAVTWVWKKTASCGCAPSTSPSARRARQLARADQLSRSSGTSRAGPWTSNGMGSQVGMTEACCPASACRFCEYVTWPSACSITKATRTGRIRVNPPARVLAPEEQRRSRIGTCLDTSTGIERGCVQRHDCAKRAVKNRSRTVENRLRAHGPVARDDALAVEQTAENLHL